MHERSLAFPIRSVRALRVGLLALLAACFGAGCGSEPDEKPLNVVIVVLDTLRPDRLGCYGHERDTSPNLDAMADEFFLFESAQSPAPWTAPSLVSLMTSLYPDAHGVRSAPVPERLSDKARTLTQVLRDRGYSTLAVTEGGYARGDFGLDQGFERYVVEDLPQGRAYEALMKRLETNLDTAEAWLDEQKDEPFMLFFHTFEVHSPRIPPAEYLKLFRPDYDLEEHFDAVAAAVEAWNTHGELSPEAARLLQLEVEVGAFTRSPLPKNAGQLTARAKELGVTMERERHHESAELVELVRDLYDAELRRTDELLTRLWDTLKRNGQWENTLVVLVSDHGEGLGDHERIGHGTRLNESVLRVLLMMRVPDERFTPRRIPDVVRLVDVMPTLLDFTGGPERGLGMQGTSLVPLMKGEPSDLEAYGHAIKLDAGSPVPLHSIRTKHWRLIVDSETGAPQLFDHRTDPDELVNVAEREPEVVQRLTDRLKRQRALDEALRTMLGSGGTMTDVDPALKRELINLGYIGEDDL